MRVRRALVAVAIAASVVVLTVGAEPAGASTVATASGTVLTLVMTGDVYPSITCVGGNTAVDGTVTSPAIACSALTKVSATGDSGNQTLSGLQLNNPNFSSHPFWDVALGDGADQLWETNYNDGVDMGAGDDLVFLNVNGSPNTFMNLGGGTSDRMVVSGADGNDTMTLTSTGSTTTLVNTNPTGPSTSFGSGVEQVDVYTYGGNDTIDASGVTAASTLTYLYLNGGDGNDTITGSAKSDALHGGAGTNHLNGGPGNDSLWSESESDQLDGGSGGEADAFYDVDSLHSGSRTLTGFGNTDNWYAQAHDSDVTARVRPGSAAGTTLVTLSLDRPGQQTIPATSGSIVTAGLAYTGEVPHKALLDIVAGPHQVGGTGSLSDTDVVDITVPSGTWTVTTFTHGVTVVPDDPTYKQVSVSHIGAYRVHGPWTGDRNRGFVHRAFRDLLFRFVSDAQRDTIRNLLVAGTTTRADVASSVIYTDEYRGLDVDRSFEDFLRRKADSSGRTYWISSLRNGKSLRQFRAQLLGSNEYFTKAGSTNAAFVRKAYNDVLGRDPDPSGLAYWTNKADSGTERGLIARQFLASTEARRNIVKNQFLRFIDRYPTSNEADTWVSTLGSSPTGEQDLIQFLVASGAYYNRS
jgi:hypothetical protein